MGYVQRGQVRRLLAFPVMLPATFAPGSIGVRSNELAVHLGSKYQFEFAVDQGKSPVVARVVMALVVLGAMVFGLIVAVKRGGMHRALALASQTSWSSAPSSASGGQTPISTLRTGSSRCSGSWDRS